jgi:hypothetical protein
LARWTIHDLVYNHMAIHATRERAMISSLLSHLIHHASPG